MLPLKDEVSFFVTIAAQLAKAIHEAAAVDEVSRMLSGKVQGVASIQGIQMAVGVAIGTAALLDELGRLESIPDRPARDIKAKYICRDPCGSFHLPHPMRCHGAPGHASSA